MPLANNPALQAPPYPAPPPFEFTEESLPEAIPVAVDQLEGRGDEFRLERKLRLAVLIGAVSLLLLGLATPFAWLSVWIGPGDYEDSEFGERLTGLETPQGKVIFVAALIGVGSVGLGLFFVRRHLSACLLVAGAAGTVAVILLLTCRRNLQAEFASWRPLARLLQAPLFGGVRFPFYVAMLSATLVVAAFVFASVQKPQELPFLRHTGAMPLVQKHGGLIGAQALAVLIGLILFVLFA